MSSLSSPLERESLQGCILWIALIACSVTGYITYLNPNHSTWLQWNLVFHLLAGLVLSLISITYLIAHFKRTKGFRRISLLLSGIISALLVLGFVMSAAWIIFVGSRESEAWVLNFHIVSASLFLVFVTFHIILHVALLPLKRRAQNEPKVPTIQKSSLVTIVLANLAIAVGVLGISYVYEYLQEPYSDQPVVSNYEYSYGSHRFRPSQTETTNNGFIDSRQIANSHKCIACHEDIAEQWMSSMHQQAAADPTYVTNVSLLAKKKGISATRYCEGCHAPVALLTGELSPGGEHGGIVGSTANIEGVSCMGCHGITSLTHMKGVASFTFKPVNDYLFAKSESTFLTKVHNLLIRLKPDQHIADLGNPLLKDPKFCSACHTQFMDKSMNNWGWVKMQDEYGAWLESPYSKQHEEGFANESITRCQDCHMPLMALADPSSDEMGQVRSHNFPAANTFVPVLRNDMGQLEAVRKFLQSNKLRISIDKPNRKNATQTLSALDETIRDTSETPYYFYLGEDVDIQLTVTNNGVGHDFPGGTVDINQAWIEFLVIDATGKTVFESGSINDENVVDPNAYFYHALTVDRKGHLVWRHDLFNMVGESFRRTIKAGDSDIVTYSFHVPSSVKSPITVTATLKYRKLNTQYARWALKENYIDIPIIDMAWDSLNIPIRERKEVDTYVVLP